MKKIAIVILGPTCVGKTDLALKTAFHCGEIISVDSMQVYQYMDIGTAKPDQNELKQVKHHLIDITTPDKQFTAGHFITHAGKLIPQIINDKKIPFLVGGTGLYFLSLIRGMVDIPSVPAEINQMIKDRHRQTGQARMFRLLERLDYEYSQKIHPNDSQRTMRALEVIITTKNKFSFYLNQQNQKEELDARIVGIRRDRKELYTLINQRVDLMMDKGLLDEVKQLKKMGYNKDHPGMKGIGYKEILEHLEGSISLDEAVHQVKKNSRRYAKRQFTWFNRMEGVNWFDAEDRNNIISFIEKQKSEFMDIL